MGAASVTAGKNPREGRSADGAEHHWKRSPLHPGHLSHLVSEEGMQQC